MESSSNEQTSTSHAKFWLAACACAAIVAYTLLPGSAAGLESAKPLQWIAGVSCVVAIGLAVFGQITESRRTARGRLIEEDLANVTRRAERAVAKADREAGGLDGRSPESRDTSA